ncbi:OmpA family protein, partial [Myroides sp. LJL119]
MINYIRKTCFLMGLLSLSSLGVLAQEGSHRKGDTKYERLAYVDAIKIYERIANKGYKNQEVLQNLADAYYFNGKLQQANIWYTDLFESDYKDKNLDAIAPELYYRYAQSLRAVENYQKSDSVMTVFASMNQDDSRAKLFALNTDYRQDLQTEYQKYQVKAIEVNSDYSDYGSFLIGDTLLFTSARGNVNKKSTALHDWTKENFTSLFATQIQEDGSFSEPQVYAPNLDSKVNDASGVVTKDGQTLYFTRNNSNEKGKRRRNKSKDTLLKIYKATRQDNGQWGDIVELPFNSDNFNTAHPALSVDEKYLYFASDRQGSLGSSDLFKVAIYPDNQYGEVENLGAGINTSGRETFPYISQDGLLFFASDGHPGLGGLDVFVTKLNAKAEVSQVVNMGSPINSSLDDFAFYIDSSNKKGFVSSNRENEFKGDNIYFFTQTPCDKQLQGVITDEKTQQVIPFAQVTITDSKGQVVEVVVADQDGYFKGTSVLQCGGKYFIKVEKPDYHTKETGLTLSATPGVDQKDVVLQKSVIALNVNDDLFKTLGLNPIYFDFDKSNIREDAANELVKIYAVMQEYPTMKIDVRSHTDSRGNDAYNMALSDRRVKSTIQWLISQGISADRLTGRGYGESQLINNCSNGVPCSIQEHQLNRRSEFIIL